MPFSVRSLRWKTSTTSDQAHFFRDSSLAAEAPLSSRPAAPKMATTCGFKPDLDAAIGFPVDQKPGESTRHPCREQSVTLKENRVTKAVSRSSSGIALCNRVEVGGLLGALVSPRESLGMQAGARRGMTQERVLVARASAQAPILRIMQLVRDGLHIKHGSRSNCLPKRCGLFSWGQVKALVLASRVE